MRIYVKPYWSREDGFAATTTALILAGVAVAGAATSAYGSMAAANAQKQSADFNSKVASNNALAAQQQASADAQNSLRRNARLRGSQIAAMSAAGVDDTGTGSDVIYDTKVQGQLDALTTLYKGQVEGANYRSQSELDQSQGKYAETSGYLSAGGTLLSGAGAGAYDYESVANNPSFRNPYGVN